MAVDNFAIGALADSARKDADKERLLMQQQAEQKFKDSNAALRQLMGGIETAGTINDQERQWMNLYDQADPVKNGFKPGTKEYNNAIQRQEQLMGLLSHAHDVDSQGGAAGLPSDPMSFTGYQEAKQKYEDAQKYATDISSGAGVQDALSKKYHTGQTLEGLLMGEGGAGSKALHDQQWDNRGTYDSVAGGYRDNLVKQDKFNTDYAQRRQQYDERALATRQAQQRAQEEANKNMYNNYLAHRNDQQRRADAAALGNHMNMHDYGGDDWLRSTGDTGADQMDQATYLKKHGNASVDDWGGNWQMRNAKKMLPKWMQDVGGWE